MYLKLNHEKCPKCGGELQATAEVYMATATTKNGITYLEPDDGEFVGALNDENVSIYCENGCKLDGIVEIIDGHVNSEVATP